MSFMDRFRRSPRVRMSGPARDGFRTGSTRVRASDNVDQDHLHTWVETRIGIEGYEASKWIVQDYGDIMIHVFDSDTRDYYKLEELWADAPKVDWENEE